MIVFNALQTTLSGGIGRYSYELSKALYSLENEIKIVIREEDRELFNFAKDEDFIKYNIKNRVIVYYILQEILKSNK